MPSKKNIFFLFVKKTPDFAFLDKKTQVVFQKPHFSTKKPQNPSRSWKTPDLVKKPQEWERWI